MLKLVRIDECLRSLNSQRCRRRLNSSNYKIVCRMEKRSASSDLGTWQRPLGVDTGIQIYNHNVRGKVPLVLHNPQMVTWYTCGPTVYDKTHVGHASTYVKVDIIQRILRDYFNYNLITAMNITDVDDKIIMRAKQAGCNWLELARSFEAEFKQDMARLNVKPPSMRGNVSTNIPIILNFIKVLLDNEQAYVAADKSVYFDVSKCTNYGKLQEISKDEGKFEPGQTKRNAADFALWKAKKNVDEPAWKTSWGGEGRPGWHIECSAIAAMFFRNKLDFHAGGLDLRFPHHENEEAQCCAYYKKKQWVNYWMHTGQLHLVGDQQKMSKSLGNIVSVTEMLQNYTADEFRMACLLSNYRNAMPYGDQVMLTARQTLRKFINFYADLSAYMQFQKPPKFIDRVVLEAQLKHMVEEFDSSLRDDFDTARAMSVLLDQMSSISRCINEREADAQQDGAYCLDLLLAAGNYIGTAMMNFGISSLSEATTQQAKVDTPSQVDVSALVDEVLSIRSKLRQQAFAGSSKNMELLAICDNLRELLQRQGIDVRDHKNGSSWSLNLQKRASVS